MIYVNQKQLDQVEYILEQSARGHHVLFDLDEIRKAFDMMALGEKKAKHDGVASFGHLALTNHSPKAKPKAREKAPNLDEVNQSGDKEAVSAAEKHIENLILQPTLLLKKTYLENLTPDEFIDVVRTYFAIVENNIFEGMEYCH